MKPFEEANIQHKNENSDDYNCNFQVILWCSLPVGRRRRGWERALALYVVIVLAQFFLCEKRWHRKCGRGGLMKTELFQLHGILRLREWKVKDDCVEDEPLSQMTLYEVLLPLLFRPMIIVIDTVCLAILVVWVVNVSGIVRIVRLDDIVKLLRDHLRRDVTLISKLIIWNWRFVC